MTSTLSMARTKNGTRSIKERGGHMDLYNLVVSAKLQKGGGGGDVDVDPVTITENGVYSASSGHAYSPVTVSVPQSGITPTGTKDINANGIYDVTNFASASVAVPGASGTSVITSNGIYDIETYKSASVNVTGIVPSGTSSITSHGIYDIPNFASVDVNVSGGGGGDHDVEDAIIQGTLSGVYVNSRISGSIYRYAFYYFNGLTSINFPNVDDVESNAFYGCGNLSAASLPNATTIGTSAFDGCSKLENVYIPKVTGIYSTCFRGCIMSEMILPSLTFLGQNAFQNCSQLVSISLPILEAVGAAAFSNCSKLSAISLPKVSSISANAFAACTKLESVYLLSNSVVSGASTTMFKSTPMSASSYLGYYGSIYVPASLVDSYKAATNWSVYADRITSYVE